MSVKLEDVAKRAGVSKATASLALNGSEKININTRTKIEQLAKEMGYHPNPYARKLVTRKSRQIGLIVPDIELHYYASLAKYLFNCLSDSGYGLSISTSMGSRLTERRVIGEMIESRVDGILLAPLNSPNEDTGYLDVLENAGIPALFVTSAYDGSSIPCVMCDLFMGTYHSMEMLYQRGYRKMAFLSGMKGAYSLDKRVSGYRQFVSDHGLKYEKVFHMENVWYDDAQQCIAKYGVPDAEVILCANDMMALGCINALRERGINVPEDMAVVGFDDSMFSKVSPIPITTVRQDISRVAMAAVTRMLNMLQGIEKEEEKMTLIPCEIISRESVKQAL